MFDFFKKNKVPKVDFNPDVQKVVIRKSICTGEETIGFKDIKTGKYTDVMFVRHEGDIEAFKKTYNITEVTRDY